MAGEELHSVHPSVAYAQSIVEYLPTRSCRSMEEWVRIVPLYREHVFAEIKPAANSRIDLRLCLRGLEGTLPDRIAASGGAAKGDRITHRIRLESVEEMDDDLRRWHRTAYDPDV